MILVHVDDVQLRMGEKERELGANACLNATGMVLELTGVFEM